MKKLYCFDFDGTLTTKDTMFLFLKFYDSRKFWIQFIKHLPLFVLLKMKLLKAEKVKRSFVASILKGEKEEKIKTESYRFFEVYHRRIIRSNASDFLGQISSTDVDCLMVTASLDLWAEPFAEYWNMELLATRAKFVDGIFSGEFETPNCNGNEKVVRIKQATKNKIYDKTIAFGDTAGDVPMLRWANEGHYRFFH